MQVTVKLFATLSDYLPSGARRNQLALEVPEHAVVADVIQDLHLPRKMVHLVLLNGIYLEPRQRESTPVTEGDAIAVWPPIAGG